MCCVKCDRTVWPQKITMTEAIKKYNIKKEDLFGGILPHTLGGPSEAVGTKDGITPQMRGLHYGQFMQNNTFTTMFMEDDVRRLAAKKHGIEDMDEYLNTKSYKCEFRRAKKEENKFNKRNYIHRLAQQNGLDPAVSLKRYECYLFEQRKCNAMTWVRGDLLLKKLGIIYADSHPNAPFYRHIDMAPSDSRCYEFLQRLMKSNHFTKFNDSEYRRALEWGGDEFRFKRILYLVKSDDPERQGQYDYKESLMPGAYSPEYEDSDSENDDGPHDRDHRFGYRMVPVTGIKDALIDDIPIKNYAADFDSELEQMIFCRKSYTGELWRYTVHDGKAKYGIAEWADPVDYCLFEAFIQQFSPEGVDPPTLSYAQLRDIWRAREVVEMGDCLDVEECRPFNAPWSWLHYPVYLQDVTYENFENPTPPAPTYTHHPALHTNDVHSAYQYGSAPWSHFYVGENARKYIGAAKAEAENKLQEERDAAQRGWNAKCEEEQRRINAKNSSEEAKWLNIQAAILAVVQKHGWDLLAEDGGRAWERAISAELAGRVINADLKGKGKAKAPRGRKGKEVVRQQG